jgi:hypothetical protein
MNKDYILLLLSCRRVLFLEKCPLSPRVPVEGLAILRFRWYQRVHLVPCHVFESSFEGFNNYPGQPWTAVMEGHAQSQVSPA